MGGCLLLALLPRWPTLAALAAWSNRFAGPNPNERSLTLKLSNWAGLGQSPFFANRALRGACDWGPQGWAGAAQIASNTVVIPNRTSFKVANLTCHKWEVDRSSWWAFIFKGSSQYYSRH